MREPVSGRKMRGPFRRVGSQLRVQPSAGTPIAARSRLCAASTRAAKLSHIPAFALSNGNTATAAKQVRRAELNTRTPLRHLVSEG